ncbi:MAG: diguanylate cyclase [Erysipelothrix sp.]|jgi:diguanylate cyclase (GGDEF)-like protein|nr:diguanylate cyclase [Erysipelothrix sp.]
MNNVISWLKQNQYLKSAVNANMSRLYYLSLLMIPISVIHIVTFTFFVVPETQEATWWRMGIIILHSLMVAMSSVISFLIFWIDNYERELIRLKLIIQILSTIVVMILGVGIAVVDQWVTTSISPFIIVSIMMALVVLMHPLISTLVYIGLFTLFVFTMPIIITDSLILTSTIMNGVTVVMMAVGLSNIMWYYYTKNEKQKRVIEVQNANLEEQKQELEQLNYRLSVLASMDSMTQLLNRREFENQVNAELSVFKDDVLSSSMMIADIDHFKRVNDQYGHPVGDELLKQFSLLLKAVLRDKDLIARWGGEEFVVMLNQANPNEAYKIAERLRRTIESTTFQINQHHIHITVSFGIAPLNTSEEEPLYTSYLRADKALYQAKESGRNKTIIFTQLGGKDVKPA